MNKALRYVYTAYVFLIFIVQFLLFFPFFMIPILVPKWFRMTGILNRIWAHIFFTMIFMPYKVDFRFKPQRNQQYIFCPNHFSYMDIPTMGLNKVPSIFVGKSDMEKIPLFGYMYRKLHITVDRASLKSRYSTLIQSRSAVEEGKNLVIFPEGGILTKHPPMMTRFKDGAFRVAIEQQIQVVPVTIPYNWIILPDESFLPVRHLMKVIFHEPIDTAGMTVKDLEELKNRTYQVIEDELKNCINEN